MTLPFKPAPDETVVKIEYCGVNFVDTYFRKGLYPIGSLPAVFGTIVALPTDQNVLNDPNYQVRNFAISSKVAINSLRSHSNYVAKAHRFVYLVPSSVSTLEAAAGLVQSLTAVGFMDEAYTVKKGDTLLIHTAAGGLGLLLTQYAKHIDNGADYVILYKNENTVQRVLEITNGEGVDAIFDGVGKDTFDADFEMIKRKGTMVSLGNASGPVPPFPPLKIVQKNVKLLRPSVSNYTYTPSESLHYGNRIFDLISRGVLKLHIHKVYPFTAQGAQLAQRDLTGGVSTGKLVLDVSRAS
ncbi:NAD(P)-binding protein [Pleurotus eryngii]|uniref:NAD(P)-binding protein n=1 Tax=Pleurotus eryngii TaxID=5323 RepID=A0A9P5ZTY7_PLEER|nr:NAD(P)-binding protein [Pleurotus eryngii]